MFKKAELQVERKVKVQLDDPQHGSIGITVSAGATVVTVIGSYTPYDMLQDMIMMLNSLAEGDDERRVLISEEPSCVELLFRRGSDTVVLDMLRFPSDAHLRERRAGQLLLAASGSYSQVCLPFWRALRNLQARFSPSDFTARWRSPFPDMEMNKLTARIRGLPR